MEIINWWFGVIDSWFGLTTTIGVVVIIGAVVYNVIRALAGRNRDSRT